MINTLHISCKEQSFCKFAGKHLSTLICIFLVVSATIRSMSISLHISMILLSPWQLLRMTDWFSPVILAKRLFTPSYILVIRFPNKTLSCDLQSPSQKPSFISTSTKYCYCVFCIPLFSFASGFMYHRILATLTQHPFN